MSITQPTAREVGHYGMSAEALMKEGLFPQMHTLLSLRQAYHDYSTGVRASIRGKFSYGERVADLVDTTDAKTLPNGSLRLVYVQQPENVVYKGEERSLRTGISTPATASIRGGKRITCEVPPSGWQVPTSDGLWNPETGLAFATVEDRDEAVRQLAPYIENHQDQFAGFESSDPQQLAEKEVSFQWRPSADSGVRSVRRDFWDHDDGPFYVYLDEDLSIRSGDVGARLR